jgi:NAD(P)H-quinone oxidoreductase subunit J
MLDTSTKNTDEIRGRLSIWLAKKKLAHRPLGFDYQGVETLQIRSEDWLSIVVALYVYGFNYLRSQCAYDVAPGGLLASVYHFTKVQDDADQPKEVCIKVWINKRIRSKVKVIFLVRIASIKSLHLSHLCYKNKIWLRMAYFFFNLGFPESES